MAEVEVKACIGKRKTIAIGEKQKKWKIYFSSQWWCYSFLEGSYQVDSPISLPLFLSPPFLDTEDCCTWPITSITHLSTKVDHIPFWYPTNYRTCFSHASFTDSSRLWQNKLEDSCLPTENLSRYPASPCSLPRQYQCIF